MMKSFITLLFLFALIAPSPLPARDKDSTETGKNTTEKFDPSRDPAKDVKGAVREAKKSGRRILLDVGGEWCKWCHYLDRFFEQNKDVADFLHEKFVVVKVNYSKENENKKFLSKYPKIPGYPHLFVLDMNGKFLWSQDTGELESGQGHDHDKVLAFLKRWAPQPKSHGG